MVHRLLAPFALFLTLTPVAFAAELTAETSDEGVLIREGDYPVLFYQRRPKTQDGEYARADYIHPLYGLDGEVLTEDFPADHLHHRGIFTAWHQLLVDGASAGDPWILEDVEYDVRTVVLPPPADGRITLTTLAWVRSQRLRDAAGAPLPILKLSQAVHVHELRDGLRRIDFEIGVRALQANVQIGGAGGSKGYGGFSFRLRLPSDVLFSSQEGAVEPTIGPVTAGPWMAVTGSYGLEGRAAGVLVLCHPLTPGKPRQWILRRQGSMQNHAYPGPKPIPLSTADPLRLRYRLLVHRDSLEPTRIEALYREYAQE